MIKKIISLFPYFSGGLILSLAMVPLMRYTAFKIGAVDRGGKGRRVHQGVVPRLGGVAIFLAFLLPMAFSLTRGEWNHFHRDILGIILASFFVFLIGVYDDIRRASILSRLAVETLAAVLVFLWGIRIDVLSNPFTGGVRQLSWLAFPTTILWIVVITNAFNLIDGLDGAAAGTGILVSAALLLMNLGREHHIALTFSVFIGSLAGFLFYNFPPASIFMGDSGSLFIGFFLGAISILSSFKATAAATMMIPILAFSMPLMDMAYAVLRRFYRGIPLNSADREHIHHKLLDMGLKRKTVVLIIYMINIVAMLILLVFVQAKIKVDFLLIFLIMVLGVVGLRLLGYIRFSDFFRENIRHFQISRHRRYFQYLIKNFQRNVQRDIDWGEFQSQLEFLVKEYDFLLTEIHIDRGGIETPVYMYSNGNKGLAGIRLEFPVICQGKLIGRVGLVKKFDDEYFLCTSELCQAISEGLCHFFRDKNNSAGMDRIDELPGKL